MLIEELKNLAAKSEIVSIERTCHDEEITGILCDVGDDLVCLNLYTNSGAYDGFCVFETDQIEEVYWGNREHLAISELISKHGIQNTQKIVSVDMKNAIIELSTIYDSVCLHKHNDEDNFDIANVISNDERWLKIHCFGTRKSLSRLHKIVALDSISRIVVNSPYQNDIVNLHRIGL